MILMRGSPSFTLRVGGLLLAALSLEPGSSSAQVDGNRLVAPTMARQVGLERMWYTQLSMDRGRGHMAGIHVHVSPNKAHTVFQVMHEGKRYAFSERDRNAFG